MSYNNNGYLQLHAVYNINSNCCPNDESNRSTLHVNFEGPGKIVVLQLDQ